MEHEKGHIGMGCFVSHTPTDRYTRNTDLYELSMSRKLRAEPTTYCILSFQTTQCIEKPLRSCLPRLVRPTGLTPQGNGECSMSYTSFIKAVPEASTGLGGGRSGAKQSLTCCRVSHNFLPPTPIPGGATDLGQRSWTEE